MLFVIFDSLKADEYQSQFLQTFSVVIIRLCVFIFYILTPNVIFTRLSVTMKLPLYVGFFT